MTPDLQRGFDNAVRLWDVATGKERAAFKGLPGHVVNVAFTPDGKSVVVGGNAAAGEMTADVHVFAVATSKEIHRWPGHPRSVMAVAIGPDGRWLATGGWDSAIKLWDPATGKLQAVLKGHTQVILALCFSADGKSIVSCAKDQTVRVWDVPKAR